MNKTKHIKIVGIIGLALLAALAVTLCHLPSAIFACGVALASVPLVLSEEQVKEFQSILGEMKGGWAELKTLPATFKSFQHDSTQLQQQMTDVRRLLASRSDGAYRSLRSLTPPPATYWKSPLHLKPSFGRRMLRIRSR